MSHALLSRISSAKLHILCLWVPAHRDKCCCIAFCGVAIPTQVEGPSQSFLQPFAPQKGPKPSLVPVLPWNLSVINEGSEASVWAGRRGRAVLHTVCSMVSSLCSASPGEVQRAFLPCLELPALPFSTATWTYLGGSAQASEQPLSARRCLLAPPACKMRPSRCKRRGIWPYRYVQGLGPQLQVYHIDKLLGKVSPTTGVTEGVCSGCPWTRRRSSDVPSRE